MKYTYHHHNQNDFNGFVHGFYKRMEDFFSRIEEGDIAEVTAYLRSFPEWIDARSNCYPDYTPIHLAAQHGHDSIIKLLLNSDSASLDAQCQFDQITPLHLAAEYERESTVKLLLDLGSTSVNARAISGEMPLHLAAMGGSAVIIERLLHSGAMPLINTRTTHGFTPLCYATSCCNVAAMDMLIRYGAQLELHPACQYEHEATIMTLKAVGATCALSSYKPTATQILAIRFRIYFEPSLVSMLTPTL